ncbi:AAA family ATPase [Limosilactobacillus kribbianus]|uniref:AAA family ATPase n=1 Tax=Limosilactobacillus kribbianus TaxID=2982695 RepID=UPI002264D823|nr:SMC family ATPase [Limosilactobacillus kribbianus]
MRPIKIEMHYFGPYDQATVDFTQFKQLFLVAGNTGAGKTTIFDAMSYALFGQTTNDRDRSATALRSDFAPASAATSVTFTFIHQGQTYRIMRKPKQTLENKKGRLIEHNQVIELVYPLESAAPQSITKIKTANAFITNLLNLTRDQFRQIVLLPQGKFRQFLDSDSSTKEALLRDLFNTTKYAHWAQELKDELSSRKKGLAAAETKLQSVKETVPDLDAELPIADWLTVAAKLQAELKKQLGDLQIAAAQSQGKVNQLTKTLHAQQELQEAIAALEKARQQAAKLAQHQQAIAAVQTQVADLQWFQEHQAAYQRWQDGERQVASWQAQAEQLAAQVKKLGADREKAVAQYQNCLDTAPQMERLRDRFKNLQRVLPLFTECEHLAIEVKRGQAQVTTAKAAQQARQQKIADLKQQITDLTAKLAALGDLAAQEKRLGQRQRQYDQLARAAADLRKLLDQQSHDRDELHQRQLELKNARAQAEQYQAQLIDLKDAYVRHQIARLARELKPGTPCPVCGSIDHPHPAVLADTTKLVTDAELDAATKKTEQRRDAQSRAQEQVKLATTHLATLAEQTTAAQRTLAEQLGTATLPDNWAAQVADQAAQLHQDEERLTELNQTAKKERTQLQTAQEQLATVQQDSQTAVTDLHRLEQRIAQQTAVLKEKQADLPADIADAQVAKRQLAVLEEELQQFDQRLTASNQQRQKLQEQLAVAQSGQRENTTNIQNGQTQQRNAKQELTAALASYRDDLTWDFWEQAAATSEQLPRLRTKVDEYRTAVHDNQAQLARLQKQVAKRPAPALSATQQALAAAQEELGQNQHRIGQVETQRNQLANALRRVEKLARANDDAQQDLNSFQTLTDVVTGNTENHLSLERYVLQSYFREVLAAANVQLARLTNGRYQFELATASHGPGAKWTGLEVNVYDDNAGKTRSARTLSGGESFMASLALALALCQIIQEQNGGISIDALFVDEGFGSLDQQALTDALRALQELEGHRMIGIISHVTELEEQIPDQLRVSSVNGRSKVSYRHELAV